MPLSTFSHLALAAWGLLVCAFVQPAESRALFANDDASRTSHFRSTFKCNGTTPATTTCIFTDVVYWNGSVYFFEADPTNTSQPPDLDIQLPWEESIRQHQRFLSAVPTTASLEGHNQQQDWPVIEQGLVWFRSRTNNMYHSLWEILPSVHLLACVHFNKCSYDPEDQLQLFFVDSRMEEDLTPGNQAARCLSSLPIEQKSASRFTTPVVVRQLAMGTGEQAFGLQQWLGPERRVANGNMSRSWHSRMRQCLGQPSTTHVSQLLRPLATIVQRKCTGHRGRCIVNLDSVLPRLQALQPNVTWQVVELEGMNLTEQVYLFGNTSLLICPHGAHLSHMLWMPKGAVILELDQYGLENDNFFNFVRQYLEPFNHLEHLHYTPRTANSSHVKLEHLQMKENFNKLNNILQQEFLSNPNCNHWFLRDDAHLNACKMWLRYLTDLVLEEDNFIDAVRNALGILQLDVADTGAP